MSTVPYPYPSHLQRLRSILAHISCILAIPSMWWMSVLITGLVPGDDETKELMVGSGCLLGYILLGFVLLYCYWRMPKSWTHRGRAIFWFCSAAYNFLLAAFYAVPVWYLVDVAGFKDAGVAALVIFLLACYVAAVGYLSIAIGRVDLAALRHQREAQNFREALTSPGI